MTTAKNKLAAFLNHLNHIGLGKERTLFIQNLAMLLNAGLPLIDSLNILQLETRTRPMKAVIQKIAAAIEAGSPLWRALEAQQMFSAHEIALIHTGEEAGNLAENMEYLAMQEEKDRMLLQKVKMAMIYPTIVLALMLIVTVGLGLFVLPSLISVIVSLNVELPFLTRMIILFTNGFTRYAYVAVPGGILFFILLLLFARYTNFKVVTQWLVFRIPGIGRLAKEATIARFGVILGGLLQAGVPIVDALKTLAEVTPIVSYRGLYTSLAEHINIGDSFSKSFAAVPGSSKLIPLSVQQLIMTGERSGALTRIILKIADIYDKKASETAQKLPVILEPLVLLFIGLLVALLAMGIIVPIYSIVGTVGR